MTQWVQQVAGAVGAGRSAVAVHVAMMLDTESEAQKLMETLK